MSFEGELIVLIFTRKVGETVVIGDHIKVKVIQIRGKQVRLGIEAPSDLLILREEIKPLSGPRGQLNLTRPKT
jgi:carbon storage regulator